MAMAMLSFRPEFKSFLPAEYCSECEENKFGIDPERALAHVLHAKFHLAIPDFFEVQLVGVVAFEQGTEIGEFDGSEIGDAGS